MDLTATVLRDELVAKCQGGDLPSYEALYGQYARAMFNTSLRIVNNRADAEDVLQDAFTAAFQWLSEFDHSSTFGAWIKRIVINKSIDLLRRRKFTIVEMDEVAIQEIPDPAPLEEDESRYKVEEIRKAVTQLPNGYRAVLSLHLFEGYDYEEISEILTISPATVRSQYHRAKLKLLNLLQQGGLT